MKLDKGFSFYLVWGRKAERSFDYRNEGTYKSFRICFGRLAVCFVNLDLEVAASLLLRNKGI